MKFLIFLLIPFSFYAQTEGKNDAQNKIIDECLTNCAYKYNYTVNMQEWQNCIDAGLKKDSTVAYLWQQKAMPYFKARKYEVGMPFIDKAVLYNAERWQPYRAFIKCIFAKTYKEAIIDFEDCKKKYGNGYVMDHTYDFYIALSCLQLNDYKKAENLLQNYVDEMLAKNGEDWVHFTALFYLGISKYEQNKLDDAIAEFDRALKKYPNYSDVKTYKGISLCKLGKKEEGIKLIQDAEEDCKNGYKLNEDNAIYETYPYQVRRK